MLNGLTFIKRFNYLSMFLLAVGIVTSFTLTGAIPPFHFLSAFFMVTALLFIYVFTSRLAKGGYQLNYTKIFLLSLLIRVVFIPIIGYLLTHINGFPFASDKDDFIYNEVSSLIADNWRMNNPNFSSGIPMSTGFYSGFPTFSAWLMWLFGKYWWIPRIGNAVISAFTVVYFVKTAKLIFKAEQFGVMVILLIFSPIFITYASLQLKDTLLIFLLSGIFYNIVYSFSKGFNPKTIALLVVLFTALIFVRAATILPILMAGIFTSFSLKREKFAAMHKISRLIMVTIVASGVIYLWFYLSKFGVIDSPDIYFGTRYNSLINESARSNAAISTSNMAFILSTPLFIIGSIILPIPLAVELASVPFFTNYNYTANIFLFALIPPFVQALVIWFRKRKEYPLLLFFVLFFFFYKIGQAFSLSLFNIRQGLPAILAIHFILPFLFIGKSSRNLYIFFVILEVIALFVYCYVRLHSRVNIG